MFSACSSKRPQVCDLLLITDDRDAIGLQIHGIKRQFETIVPRLKLKDCPIFDYEREKHTIQCEKVVFVLSQHTGSLTTMVPAWLQGLEIDTGDLDRYLVINHDDMLDKHTLTQADNVIHVATLEYGYLWWPSLLLFYFKRNKRDLEVPCFLINTAVNGEYSEKSVRDIAYGLKQIGIGVSDVLLDSRCCILVTDKGKDSEVTLGDEMKGVIRKARLNGCRVHTVSAAGVLIPPRLRWVTDWAHKGGEMLRFWLWVLVDLGLLEIKIRGHWLKRPLAPMEPQLHESNNAIKVKWRNLLLPTDNGEDSERFYVIETKTADEPWTAVSRVEPKERLVYTYGDIEANKTYYFRTKLESEDGVSHSTVATMTVLDKRKLSYLAYALVLSGIVCPPLLAYMLTPFCWFEMLNYRRTGRKHIILVTTLTWTVVVYTTLIAISTHLLAPYVTVAGILLPALLVSTLSTLFGVVTLHRRLGSFMTLSVTHKSDPETGNETHMRQDM